MRSFWVKKTGIESRATVGRSSNDGANNPRVSRARDNSTAVEIAEQMAAGLVRVRCRPWRTGVTSEPRRRNARNTQPTMWSVHKFTSGLGAAGETGRGQAALQLR